MDDLNANLRLYISDIKEGRRVLFGPRTSIIISRVIYGLGVV